MVGKNYANKVGSETQGAKAKKITDSDFPQGSGQTNTPKRQFGGVKRKGE